MQIYWVWLSTRKLSDREKIAVLTHFGSAEDVYYANDFRDVPGLDAEAQTVLGDKSLEEAEQILQQAKRQKIRVLTWADADYPARLKNIVDPPLVLYCRGQLPDLSENVAIGVVGTRKASVYGMRTARRIGAELAACGGVVISGAAAGIDTEAMEGALSQGGTTIGVLGCGVDKVFPASNWQLYEKVTQQGCLLSEFVPGTIAYKWNFPRRNRIISGLSQGVLVVEAPKNSGALITARQALEQGRDIYAVPGNVDVASCQGSNALLREGATMVTGGWDILSEYVGLYPNKLRQRPLEEKVTPVVPERIDNPLPLEYSVRENGSQDPAEARILQALTPGKMHINMLTELTGMTSGEVMSALTMMEIEGLVQTLPGGWVEKL